MWYFTWILGVLLACAFGIINALWLESQEGMEQHTAVLDPLTKLPARVEFLTALEQAIEQYKANHAIFTVLLVGLSSFKSLSDDNSTTLDQSVLTVADIIKQEIRRPIDFVSRYDAATFAIILPATNAVTALPIARRMCEWAESVQTMQSADRVLGIGIAEYPADIDCEKDESIHSSMIKLLQITDKALKATRQKDNAGYCCAAELDKHSDLR